MEIVNPFNGDMTKILQNTTYTTLDLPNFGNGYKLSVNVTAYTKGIMATAHKAFLVQPKSNVFKENLRCFK